MKLYEIASIKINKNGEYGDEYQYYLGFNLDEALEKNERAMINYANATKYDQERTVIEARVYEIADETDISDEDAIIDAICECGGYDLIEY